MTTKNWATGCGTVAARRSVAVSSRQLRSGAMGGAIRLNLRGRIVVSLVSALLVWGCFGLVSAHEARSDMGATSVSVYTVRPGDTLWGYASTITPEGGDVSETVQELKALNNLSSSSLQIGQRIVVPVL